MSTGREGAPAVTSRAFVPEHTPLAGSAGASPGFPGPVRPTELPCVVARSPGQGAQTPGLPRSLGDLARSPHVGFNTVFKTEVGRFWPMNQPPALVNEVLWEIRLPEVRVCQGCGNRMPDWVDRPRAACFLTTRKAGRPKSQRCQHWLVLRPLSLACGPPSSLSSHGLFSVCPHLLGSRGHQSDRIRARSERLILP